MTDSCQAFHPHSHQHCVDDALRRAGQLCESRGARLTPLRQRVLELIWQSHRPMGAYALLDALGPGDGEKKPAPPTVYRALEFLLEQRLIHRIASLNAYVGCPDPEHRHAGYFMICHQCGNAAEIARPERIAGAIADETTELGFLIESQTLEIVGVCEQCQHA